MYLSLHYKQSQPGQVLELVVRSYHRKCNICIALNIDLISTKKCKIRHILSNLPLFSEIYHFFLKFTIVYVSRSVYPPIHRSYTAQKLVFFSSKSLNLLYSQQISPQFIYFISIFTCGEFHICGEF